ncbi:MAG TPA: hypothetical protein VGP93_00710 [Polyangiaceae bacterium]|nr:hypothetical protein [Polyangiaceae bacterium]
MKTTVEIPAQLLREARALAAREGTTLRALVEAGLRTVIADRRHPTKPLVVRDARFHGRGLQPEFRDGDWARLRNAAYEGRGG